MPPCAEEIFFQAFRPRLLRDSINFLGALQAEAPDMVHDTFLASFPRLAKYSSSVPAYTWLRQTCLRLCYARLRDRGSVLQCLDAELGGAMRLLGMEKVATENLEVQKHQRLELLRELIKGLNPGSRQIIELRNMHGMSYAMVSATLGVSPAELLRRLLEARYQLRRLAASPGRIPIAA